MATFFNWSSTDFTYPLGGVNYTFKAGKVYDRVITSDAGEDLLLSGAIPTHFAKHLADREINVNKTNPQRIDLTADLIARALTLPAPEVTEATDVGETGEAPAALETIESPVKAKAKPGRKPKALVAPADEFVGV